MWLSVWLPIIDGSGCGLRMNSINSILNLSATTNTAFLAAKIMLTPL